MVPVKCYEAMNCYIHETEPATHFTDLGAGGRIGLCITCVHIMTTCETTSTCVGCGNDAHSLTEYEDCPKCGCAPVTLNMIYKLEP